jgi:cellulose synthase/poly-beta-1,6-N-acetylglucosamine synthase-like glycosyltransferase
MSAEFDIAVDYLTAQSFASLLALYWFVVVFEFPRYLMAFAFVIWLPLRRTKPDATTSFRVSVLITGHNEAKPIERCVRSMHEQSRPPDEIIVVSDGSSDEMRKVMAQLLHDGLIDHAHSTQIRSGKSAGSNMAGRWATGDIIVTVDCDCSFDRDAIRNIVSRFDDPDTVAVSGNITPRNTHTNLLTAFQAIEYMITISLGKQALNRLGQISCVSGAFGAYRSENFRDVQGFDAGSGEDLDLTLRLRRQGGKVEFAADAICFTDVPVSVGRLIRQRLRWERDALRLRYRKHGALINPFSTDFTPRELFHELEYLLFNVIAALALPFYVGWLFTIYGVFALHILVAAQLGLLVLDIFTFMIAASVTPGQRAIRLIPYLPGYGLYNGYFTRLIRVVAYVQEWVFQASYSDNYVPQKVNLVRD